MNIKTVYKGGIGEIEEKKSRFIANVHPINSEEAAIEFISEIKKKYYDARHNCYAYIVDNGQKILRSSDDGEPSGTAGRPILEVLQGENLTNTIIVVTRYFGGTLLGTGGLVRAYTSAAKEGLKNSTIIEKQNGKHIFISTDYEKLGKIQYIISERSIFTLNTVYTDTVSLELIVPENSWDAFMSVLTEATNGKIKLEDFGNTEYCDIPGEGLKLF